MPAIFDPWPATAEGFVRAHREAPRDNGLRLVVRR
ncbi:hypothetical protein FHU13_000983 [Methylobacterium sp. R2-1]|nr:hypothetical protein [Methylobacterium sp. R2-1]